MRLALFQNTVREYKRFTQQLPINYSKAMSGDFSDSTYVAAQTRLMLLRKYTRSGRGNLYLIELVTEAIRCFPEHINYLSEFQTRFLQSCDQSLIHTLADGTDRTLDESIDDTMYGLHLHADVERILRIAQDNELLRLYCIVTFVKEIESLVIELFDFFEANGVSYIEKAQHLRAPAIHLEVQNSDIHDVQRVSGSPFWSNLIGFDITEENSNEIITSVFKQYSYEEWKIWKTAYLFTQLLVQERFSYDEMKNVVYENTIADWGDFSEAIAYYKTIPSPGMSSVIRYNDKHNVAYINIYPRVEEGFVIETTQIISDIYVITLVRDDKLDEWRVYAFGGHEKLFIRY